MQDKLRFLTARIGDHLLCPFQCDLCHFRNIQQRDPIDYKSEDIKLLRCIRRANLDSLWDKETQTVSKNFNQAIRAQDIALSIGIKDPFPRMGPYPLEDTFGMKAACVMLIKSLDTGKYSATVQFSTMRKMRSTFSNIYHASVEGYSSASVLAKDTRKLLVTKCPTYGPWFEHFIRGCHKRMGDIVKPDRALSLEILHHILTLVDRDWENANEYEKYKYAREASFYLIAFCGALRGEEVPMANLTGILKHWDAGAVANPPHVLIALLGRFKGELGEQYHRLPLASITSSGLQVRLWIGRLLDEYQRMSICTGPLFRSEDGAPIKASELEEDFFARLERVQEMYPHLLPLDVAVSEEYGIYRSFRRGATSEAVNRRVKPHVIEANNRWRKVERASGRQASFEMRDHYTDPSMILDQFLLFSKSL
jgi:hypothetical protein